ncbi:MAG: hypothetical protein GX663_07005 [Clostridiales bacterium]|nr:hypothetical protein [Clostridiales bacterium]
MSYYNANQYDKLVSEANNNNPESMYKLAMLYSTGAINSSSDEDIFWLEKFLNSKEVKAIIADLDDDEGSISYADTPFDHYKYYDMIIEAGIAVGLYYMNASKIEEAKLSQTAFYFAWLASKCDYIEIKEDENTTDILSLMEQIDKRISMLKERREKK